MRPQARTKDFLVRELSGETLLYDLESHRAHCLNRSAALVFARCDGTRTAAEIAEQIAAESGAVVSADLVELAIEELQGAGLLVEVAPGETDQTPREPSRRDLLRLAGAALLLPAVASVVAPTPAEAATCYFDCIDPGTGLPRPDNAPCNCGGPICTICLSGACQAGC